MGNDIEKINFDVVRKKLITVDGDETNRFAIMRKDTNGILGVVSDAYNIIEHKVAFKAADEALKKLGGFSLKKLELTRTGSRMYAHFEQDKEMSVGGGDDLIRPTLVMTNSLDGYSRFGFMLGAYRLVCKNGLMAGVSLMNINVKHTANVDVNDVAEKGKESLELFGTEVMPIWNRMNNVKLSLNDAVAGMLGRKSVVPEKITQRVKEIAEGLNQTDLTVWQLFNHYTYHLTHEYTGSMERRMELNIAASRVITKQFIA